MFLGALVGTVLLLRTDLTLTLTLGLALLMFAATSAAAWRLSAPDAPWARHEP